MHSIFMFQIYLLHLKDSALALRYEDCISILWSRPIKKWDMHVSQHAGCIVLFQKEPSDFQIKKHITITETLSVLVSKLSYSLPFLLIVRKYSFVHFL